MKIKGIIALPVVAALVAGPSGALASSDVRATDLILDNTYNQVQETQAGVPVWMSSKISRITYEDMSGESFSVSAGATANMSMFRVGAGVSQIVDSMEDMDREMMIVYPYASMSLGNFSVWSSLGAGLDDESSDYRMVGAGASYQVLPAQPLGLRVVADGAQVKAPDGDFWTIRGYVDASFVVSEMVVPRVRLGVQRVNYEDMMMVDDRFMASAGVNANLASNLDLTFDLGWSGSDMRDDLGVSVGLRYTF